MNAYIVNASEYQWLEDNPEIKVAVVADRLPLEYVDHTGTPAGYAIDTLNSLAFQTRLKLEYQIFSSVSEAILALQHGQVDMLSSASTHRRLSPFVSYTVPSWQQPLALFNPLQQARLRNMQQLTGKSIAVVAGSSAQEVLLENYPEVEPLIYASLADAIRSVVEQQTIALLAGSDEVAAHLRGMPRWHLQQSFILDESLQHQFAIRDDWKPLVALLNRGLLSMDEAQLAQSYQRWQAYSAQSGDATSISYWWFVGLLMALFVVSISVILLRQKFVKANLKSTQLREQLEYWKNHDEVTGLPNRRHVTRLLTSWLDDAVPLSVLMFDFPRQNEVFENFGQRLGEVTKEAYAKRVQKSLRKHYPEAQLAYWYHHYFVVVVPNVNKDKEVIEIAKQIVQSCRGWLRLEQLQLLTRCHVGYCSYHPRREALHSDTLLANTFTALNHAVKTGVSICRYRPDLSQAGLVKLTLESKLRKAIGNNELDLFFQPQFCLKTNKMIGAEVLLRWFTPEGAISPDEFVPVAEETGLVLQLDKWVFQNAMRFMARFSSQLPEGFKLSVNFSATTVSLGHAEKIAINYASQWQVNPQRICIEITESAMMEQPTEAKASIQRMRDAGFGIAIDDFGTGYSSMAYLKHLPVTILKIDRAFVSGLEENLSDQHIVKAMVMIARSMKYQVLIEGIETQAQANLASVMGCEQAQGYFFARPLPQNDFVKNYLTKPQSKENLRLVVN
ncbi:MULTISPECIES: putative bifunctional diguanylate cyclase/phosphodiesterase [unclassified Agarivorans]|uniref:putative bifunctional diguanylate cyclase/phosphodiesterase n=1 Tax=unclassified Agarivorans TaxID=2636026 RepID=UPI0026E2C703|nr:MULTISPECIES: EAL domain-containing protein [unclassified Agarivorans]MDO6686205.1 EAL domain-containing protein [Agarivorans sp. 3_MG-2023]MDO6716346.1 EAL domain-containing protein [Agarivorans sp. 2_MG-2023]